MGRSEIGYRAVRSRGLRVRRRRLRRAMGVIGMLAVGLAAPGLLGPPRADAAPSLSVTPLTWGVMGLDSNNVAAGINVFPLGGRVCNTGDLPATGVVVSLVWDSANPYIAVETGTPATRSLGTVAAGRCVDTTFTVEIARNAAAYTTSRRFHLQVTADGGLAVSSPTPREVYVEYLVSQARNAVNAILGPSTMFVGETHSFTVLGKTAPGGYEQLETFITANGTLFAIGPTTVDYETPVGGRNDRPYADACGWDPVPTSPTYRSCVGPEGYAGGKAGGEFSQRYLLTALQPGSTRLGGMIYDFSGSSYHYNSDAAAGLQVRILDPSEGALVSGVVWSESDGDGVRDEPGRLGGVPVVVWGVGLDGSAGTADDYVQRSVVTATDGTYAVLVPPGESVYFAFGVPSSMTFAPADAGGNDLLDSDVTGAIAPGATRVLTFPGPGPQVGPDAGVEIPVTATKTPGVSAVTEPGGMVTFTVRVDNGTSSPATLTTLSDDVFGDLLDPANPLVTANSCPTASRSVGSGGSFTCSFQALVTGTVGGPPHVDVVSAGVSLGGLTVTVTDDATVGISDALPSVAVTKSAFPGSVDEPGGWVTFSITVTNTSVEPVTLTSLSDDVYGDLRSVTNPLVADNSCAAAPASIGIGTEVTCSFAGFVGGTGTGPDHVDTVTAVVADDEGNTTTGAGSARVAIADVAPSVLVEKAPSPGSVPEPGGWVTFAVTVTNTSVEPVTLTSLSDDVFGDLLDGANPLVTDSTCPGAIRVLAADRSVSCSFRGWVPGDHGDPDHRDIVTAVAVDDEGTTGTGSATARVGFDDVPPSVAVNKASWSGSVTEPGGWATFAVTVTNGSVEPVTVTALSDDVFGDLFDPVNPLVRDTTCAGAPRSLAVGAALSCTFDGFVAGNGSDPDHVDTVTATVADDDGGTASASDSAWVGFVDAPPSVSVSKTPSSGAVDEPGEWVTFTVTVTNTSVEAVVLSGLSDDVFGDLLDPDNALVEANSCAAIPGSLAVGEAFTCSFDGFVAGDHRDPAHHDTVTVTVADDEGNSAVDQADAVVSFDDALPTIAVAKTPSQGSVDEPGAWVEFTVTVVNTSAEPVTVVALGDDVFGDLRSTVNPEVRSSTCAAAPGTIGVGATWTCSFEGFVAGNALGPAHLDVVTVVVTDDDGNRITGEDWATVSLRDVLPAVSVTKGASPATVAEPGAVVTFDVVVRNAGVEPLVVEELVDDVYGDLLDWDTAGLMNNSCPSLPAVLSPGAAFACSFDAFVLGNGGDPDHRNTITFSATDDEGNRAGDAATAVVPTIDLPPGASVTKTASVGAVVEPGGPVTFTVAITNLGPEPLAVLGITDSVFGDLLHAGEPGVSENSCADLRGGVLPAGTFTCRFTAEVAGRFGDPAHVNVVSVTLADDEGSTIVRQASATVDFAPAGSSLTGMVFADLDRDGHRDPGEPGLEGIEVWVSGSGGGTTTVTTDGTGGWAAVVLPGPATVAVNGTTVPPGHQVTTANATQVANALAGEAVATADVGYGPPLGGVAGVVFVDLDGDPIRDGFEPPLEGIAVELRSGAAMVASTTTDSAGGYTFPAVIAGNYTVVVGPAPAGFAASVDPDGGSDSVAAVTVAAGLTTSDVDFGFRGTASLGDTVWIDENEDGWLDEGEGVLPGASVSVTWWGSDGVEGTGDDHTFPSAVTDDNGWYRFTGLPPGDYRVAVDVSGIGVVFAPTTATSLVTTMEPGEAFTAGDFGFVGEDLPMTGIDAEELMVVSMVMVGLGWLVAADGRRRRRPFTVALDRLD